MNKNFQRPILVIDAMNLFMRHFIANPTMSDHGHHVGGTIGFLKSIRLLTERFLPQRIILVWEGGGSLRRRAIFPEYKKGRKPQRLNRFYGDDLPNTVENRNYQVHLLVEILKNVPANQMYVSDCEADDAIGYMARYLIDENKCLIVSSDKDLYQLLSDDVKQWSPGQKRLICKEDVLEKFHVSVSNFCLTRCFCGDASDGIPGIKGAGFRSMAKRFPELADPAEITLAEILRLNSQRMQDSKIKLFTEIHENYDILERNWKLMNLDTFNLAATQIQKIEFIFNTFDVNKDKISIMRTLLKEGITSFDVNEFYMALNTLN